MGVIRNKKAFFAFLLPGLLFYIFTVFYPIVESIRLSFMEWGGIGDKVFVGLDNYVKMFHDPVFYTAFINNLIYLLIVVGMQLSIGLFFAILLTYMTKYVTLVKTLYYVPCIITTVAITQLFRSMYSVEPMGLLNQFLEAVGLGGMVTSWLADVGTVLAAVSIPEGWRFTGMYMVIFYVEKRFYCFVSSTYTCSIVRLVYGKCVCQRKRGIKRQCTLFQILCAYRWGERPDPVWKRRVAASCKREHDEDYDMHSGFGKW